MTPNELNLHGMRTLGRRILLAMALAPALAPALPPRVANPRKRDHLPRDYEPAIQARCSHTRCVKRATLAMTILTLASVPVILGYLWLVAS